MQELTFLRHLYFVIVLLLLFIVKLKLIIK